MMGLYLRRLGQSMAVLVLTVTLVLPVTGSTGSLQWQPPNLAVPIPGQTDWVDYGPIFTAGALGEWDYILWGGFAGTAVKKNGVYYLYYQGVSGYRLIPDETVTWRTIGVATSPDGINFTKYHANPVISWFPHNAGEEGATSGGATLAENGDILLYYGANTEISATLVNADGRLAGSTDGLAFTDGGVALDHQNSSLWGSGDELFPIIAIQDAGRYVVYYIPNGVFQRRQLGVAWGSSRTNLTNSAGALSGGAAVPAWGMGGSAKVGPDTYALFLNDVPQAKTEVRLASLHAPHQLSAPLATYQFSEAQQATVFLDNETNTWFMYYRGPDSYGIKLAPAGPPDTTPPTAPAGVVASPGSDRQINLSWSPASDADTGVVVYHVFRDGLKVATVKGWQFSDTDLAEKTGYRYAVSAVNYHGVEGPRSAAVLATTLADVTPPNLTSVATGSNPGQVRIVFDEPVEQRSAETVTNYAIDPPVTVTTAALGPDLQTVTLTTAAQVNGRYRLTVRNVRDRAVPSNPVAPGTAASYLYTGLDGLAAAWPLDEAAGDTASDLAAYGNHGALTYLIKPNLTKPGPTWTPGKIGSALYFDGLDDQVTIAGAGALADVTDGSHTFALWARPDDAPPATTANDSAYSLLVRQYTGLYYDADQTFRAEIRLSDGGRLAVSSAAFQPGIWQQVIMVVNESAGQLRLYVNGQEVPGSPASFTGQLADHGDAPYYLGASEPLANYYEQRLRGALDEVRLYKRALTPAEVQTLYGWVP